MSTRPEHLPTHLPHHIGGRDVDSIGGETFEVLDPVTNRTYATWRRGQQADVDAAVAAASAAFEYGPWPRMKARERAGVLNADRRHRRLPRRHASPPSRRSTRGLPITQARGQARRAAENFRFFADLVVAQRDDAYQVPGTQLNYVHRKPKGVAGLITPWNTPFMLETWKLAPALASGCTVVLKPAEFTPLSASLWADIFAEAGVPTGVFNLVHGIGEEAGDALVKHPDVPLISFTGETRTGQVIFRNCAEHLKAHVDGAGRQVARGRVRRRRPGRGARLHAVRRVLAQRRALHRGQPDPGRARRSTTSSCARFAERAGPDRGRRPVRPEDRGRRAGAPRALREGHVLRRDRQGARAGWSRAAAAPTTCPTGNYVAPTVFADVPPDARIFQEEIFGPVVAITPFDDEAEALELANATRYGLAAYIWTNDLKRAHTFAQSVEAGHGLAQLAQRARPAHARSAA